MTRKKTTKSSKPISEKQRAEDDRLRRELENADPGKFKRLVKTAFPFFKNWRV